MQTHKFYLAAALLLMVTGSFAQTAPKTEQKVEKKEITIEKKEGTKKEKMVIVIDGDNVTINGKPSDQYKGDERIIIDKDIIINGNSVVVPGQKGPVRMQWKGDSRPILGVFTEKDDKGAKISRVNEKTAAEKAGLKEGDIITAINTTPVTGPDELTEAIRKLKIGDEINVTYLRGGKTQKVKATLGKSDEAFVFSSEDFKSNLDKGMPYTFSMPRMPEWDADQFKNLFVYESGKPKYGMSIQDDEDNRGVRVTDVENESNAFKAGLKTEDIITEIEGEKIEGVDDLKAALDRKKDQPSVVVKVLRNGKTENLTLKVPRKLKSASL